MTTYIIIFITCAISIASFRNKTLLNRLLLSPYDVIHRREWYRLITHTFIHADYVHLLVNMFVLLSFGSYIERLFTAYQHRGMIANSTITYILLYFGGAIFSTLYDLIKHRNDSYFASLGASGAVSAILFSTIFFNPWGSIYFFGVLPIPGIVFAVLYIVYSQYMGRKATDNINHHAHLYGALYGFLFPLMIDPSLLNIFITNLTKF